MYIYIYIYVNTSIQKYKHTGFWLSPCKTSKSPSQPGGVPPPSAAGLRWIAKNKVAGLHPRLPRDLRLLRIRAQVPSGAYFYD